MPVSIGVNTPNTLTAAQFGSINAINVTKKDLMKGSDNDAFAESAYVPFITNRTLSYFPDTVMHANEMNTYHQLDDKLQYDYLFFSIRQKKRFFKRDKKTQDNDLELVRDAYKYNIARAEEALSILNPSQIEQIRDLMTRGKQ